MQIESPTRLNVKDAIRIAIRRKLSAFDPETNYKPFHDRLIGADRMQLYTFVQSLNTTFGTSIYEPVAAAIAKRRFVDVRLQYDLLNEINQSAVDEVMAIMGDLASDGRSLPDKVSEIERIRNTLRDPGNQTNQRTPKVDLRVESADGEAYLFDITTVKPNINSFRSYKQTLLMWIAKETARKPELNVHTAIALPYNPYFPKPYERWTMQGMLDTRHEVYVGEEFWNFLCGDEIFDDLLECFREVGVELRPELDQYFARFAS